MRLRFSRIEGHVPFIRSEAIHFQGEREGDDAAAAATTAAAACLVSGWAHCMTQCGFVCKKA